MKRYAKTLPFSLGEREHIVEQERTEKLSEKEFEIPPQQPYNNKSCNNNDLELLPCV